MLYLIHLVTGDTIIAELTQEPTLGNMAYAEDLGVKRVHCEHPMRLVPVSASRFYTLKSYGAEELLTYESIIGEQEFYPITLAPASILWSAPVSTELTEHYENARETKVTYEFEM